MIKKIIACIFCLLMLTSCVNQNRLTNISILSERINNAFDEEIFKETQTKMLKENDYNVIYWMPEKYQNICVCFFCNSKTGNIEKSKIILLKNDKENNTFINLFEKAIRYNNKYIVKSNYSTDKYNSVSFTDRRYDLKETEPQLKKELKDSDLY